MLEFQVKNAKALYYLEQHLEEIKDDPYALAIVSYALHLTDSTKKAVSLKMLEAHKINDTGQLLYTTFYLISYLLVSTD